ncbi:hypothetical protein ASZ90_017007 [hydrocarbon metagenome]|uniref:Uncharacterized protein n=1 Tax=hydrocarbon metagenome TaxID=938273 RepID=A0A0W8EAA8_9ZZZZ
MQDYPRSPDTRVFLPWHRELEACTLSRETRLPDRDTREGEDLPEEEEAVACVLPKPPLGNLLLPVCCDLDCAGGRLDGCKMGLQGGIGGPPLRELDIPEDSRDLVGDFSGSHLACGFPLTCPAGGGLSPG